MSLLTSTDLEMLTGRVQAAAQIRWLTQNRVRHYVNANGKPVVTWAAVNKEKEAPVLAPINWQAVE